MTVTHPALVEFDQQRRAAFIVALTHIDDHEQAAAIAQACGYTISAGDLEAAYIARHTIDHPAVALDIHEFDHGPLTGDRHSILTGIQDTARNDLDAITTRVIADPLPVHPEEVALAVLRICQETT